jgi:bifunctional UDP-N-acetylglucosamine pyrophosphorylase/glucosamine-1-phosphate N-acetyltransferase
MLKAVILAAGQGTRMKSKLPKVVHKVMGKCMVEHAITAAREAGADEICVVVGHGADIVKREITSNVTFVTQDKQLGTGHAVKCARDFIGKDGSTLILFGDTPLITGETLNRLVKAHEFEGNAITVLSAILDNPAGYGRIIRSLDGTFIKSVEHKDATDEERLCNEVNSGMYVFESAELYEALDLLTNDNAQGEYYLPDTLTIIKDKGLKVDAMVVDDPTEIEGVNSRVQLAHAEDIMKKRINNKWMSEGVTIIDPDNTYITPQVVIENDVVIYPDTFIMGDSVIHTDCVIGPFSYIKDAEIESGMEIEPYSRIVGSRIVGR